MKIKILLILSVSFILNLYCSGMQITDLNVKKELHSTADFIKNDKNNILKLDDKIIGNKGYFYILSSNGKIYYHPKKTLINSDFSKYPFVQKILKEKNGCLSFNAEGMQRFIYFNEIDPDKILCLTLESIEFAEHVNKCDSKIEEK